MRVVLAPQARAELRKATAWYRKRSPDAARRLVDAYKHAKSLVAESPLRWAEVAPGVRRVLFDTFPYALLYVVEDKRTIVLAVKHHKRHPEYWRDDDE